MSNEEEGTIERLDRLDEHRNAELSKLPFFKRMKRRYTTGDAFVAWNISTVATWPSAFPAGVAAGAAGFKLSMITSGLAKAWGATTTAFAAVVNLVTHAA